MLLQGMHHLDEAEDDQLLTLNIVRLVNPTAFSSEIFDCDREPEIKLSVQISAEGTHYPMSKGVRAPFRFSNHAVIEARPEICVTIHLWRRDPGNLSTTIVDSFVFRVPKQMKTMTPYSVFVSNKSSSRKPATVETNSPRSHFGNRFSQFAANESGMKESSEDGVVVSSASELLPTDEAFLEIKMLKFDPDFVGEVVAKERASIEALEVTLRKNAEKTRVERAEQLEEARKDILRERDNLFDELESLQRKNAMDISTRVNFNREVDEAEARRIASAERDREESRYRDEASAERVQKQGTKTLRVVVEEREQLSEALSGHRCLDCEILDAKIANFRVRESTTIDTLRKNTAENLEKERRARAIKVGNSLDNLKSTLQRRRRRDVRIELSEWRQNFKRAQTRAEEMERRAVATLRRDLQEVTKREEAEIANRFEKCEDSEKKKSAERSRELVEKRREQSRAASSITQMKVQNARALTTLRATKAFADHRVSCERSYRQQVHGLECVEEELKLKLSALLLEYENKQKRFRDREQKVASSFWRGVDRDNRARISRGQEDYKVRTRNILETEKGRLCGNFSRMRSRILASYQPGSPYEP